MNLEQVLQVGRGIMLYGFKWEQYFEVDSLLYRDPVKGFQNKGELFVFVSCQGCRILDSLQKAFVQKALWLMQSWGEKDKDELFSIWEIEIGAKLCSAP